MTHRSGHACYRSHTVWHPTLRRFSSEIRSAVRVAPPDRNCRTPVPPGILSRARCCEPSCPLDHTVVVTVAVSSYQSPRFLSHLLRADRGPSKYMKLHVFWLLHQSCCKSRSWSSRDSAAVNHYRHDERTVQCTSSRLRMHQGRSTPDWALTKRIASMEARR